MHFSKLQTVTLFRLQTVIYPVSSVQLVTDKKLEALNNP